MKCNNHVLDYEKKSPTMTWLRCINCKEVIGWLEDTKISGVPTDLSTKEREELR